MPQPAGTAPETWHRHAACHGTGDLMYPAPGDDQGTADARAVCAACPVTGECLAEALRQEGPATRTYRYGIRAGTTPYQRRRMWELHHRDQAAEQAKRLMPPGGRPPAPCGTEAALRRHMRRGEPVDEACRRAGTRRRQEREEQQERDRAGGRGEAA